MPYVRLSGSRKMPSLGVLKVKKKKAKQRRTKIKIDGVFKLEILAEFLLNNSPSNTKQAPAEIKKIKILSQSGDLPIAPL